MKTYTLKTFIVMPGIFLLIAAAPLSCNVARQGGVFKSENFGESWEQKVVIGKKQNIASRQILVIEIDPFNPDIIYAGTENGLYRSANGADSWELVQDEKKNPDRRSSILDIKINPQNPNLVYAAVFQDRYGRVFRRTDPGSAWEQMYIASKEGVMISSIEIDRTAPNIYIGTSEGGLLKSSDFGLSWKNIGWFNASVDNIEINPQDNKIIYVLASGRGLFKSSDQGANWQLLPDPAAQNSLSPLGGFGAASIRGFFIDAKNVNNLYAGTSRGIFLSTDGGQTWKPFSSLISPESAPVSAMAQDKNNASVLYYGADSIIYRTQNGGQTWTVHQLPTRKIINRIGIDHINPNVIYVGVK